MMSWPLSLSSEEKREGIEGGGGRGRERDMKWNSSELSRWFGIHDDALLQDD